MRQGDKSKIRNTKVTPSEMFVANDELAEIDMWMDKLKTSLKKFEPRLRVWKLKDEKISEEYTECGQRWNRRKGK